MSDEIAQAVLAREEIVRYLRTTEGESDFAALEKVIGYLEELQTTQRYPIYRRLKHPLYPILRKIERIEENVQAAQEATRAGRVIYISNHKSHLDYLVEPLVLDDNGVRPPVIGVRRLLQPLQDLPALVLGAEREIGAPQGRLQEPGTAPPRIAVDDKARAAARMLDDPHGVAAPDAEIGRPDHFVAQGIEDRNGEAREREHERDEAPRGRAAEAGWASGHLQTVTSYRRGRLTPVRGPSMSAIPRT